MNNFLFGTLRGRLILSIASVIAATMTLFIVYLSSQQRKDVFDQQRKDAIILSETFSVSAAGWISANDIAGLQELVEVQRRYPELVFLVLTDENGRILAHTDKSKTGQFLLGLPPQPKLTILSKTSDLVDIASPVLLAGRQVGWVRIGLGQKAAKENIQEIFKNSVLYGISAILIGILIAWWLGRQMTKRLYAVQNTINEVAKGNPMARSSLTGIDEAAVLSKEFNDMLDALSEQEVKLHKSDIRFEKFFNLATYPLVIINKEGAIISLNASFEKTFGYANQDIPTINEWWQLAFPDPDYRKLVIASWENAAKVAKEKNTNIESAEHKVRCKNGEQRSFVISGTLIDEDLLITFFDITNQKRATEELLSSQKLLRDIVDNTKALIYILDTDGNFIMTNKELESLFNLEPGYAIGKKREDIMSSETATAHRINDLKVINSGIPITVEEQNSEPDGIHTYISSKFPLLDSNGKLYALCGISTDITDHIRAEEKIKQLSQAVEQSPVSIIITNMIGDIEYVNPKFIETTGYSYEEAYGKNPRFLSSGYTTAEEYKELWKSITEGKEWHGVFQNKKKDGTFYWESTSISPIINAQGKTSHYIAIKEDITERMKIDSEIRKSQIYTRSLIEASLDPLVTINAEAKITDVNEALVKVTGIPRNELIGTEFADYFTEPEKAKVIYDEVIEKGFVADYQLVIKGKGDNLTEVLFNASIYKDEKDNVAGVLAAARDITNQKIALQYARRLIEASIDPLFTINEDGKITDMNFATVKALGAPRREIIDTNFSDYFTEPEKAREGYRQVFEKGFIKDYPLTIKDAKGKLIEVSFNASVYMDNKGKVLGIFADARDVSAQKQASQYARSLIEASLDPLVTISAEGKITDVNEASIKATGVPREELIGADFSNYFTEPEKAQEGYHRAFENGFVADYPLTIKNKNGKLTDVLYNASVYKDDKGNVMGLFAAARDITAQKQASHYARSLIEASLDPLVTISADGKITDVNFASVKVTGVPREELIGTDFSNYFTEPEKAKAGYLQVFESGFVVDYPLTIKNKNEKLTDVLYNASVYRDDNDNVLGVFAAARDITAQKQLLKKEVDVMEKESEKIEELEKFKNLFMGREIKLIELEKEVEELKSKVPDVKKE